MSNEMLETFTEQTQSFFGPFAEANKLFMDKFEKLVNLQSEAAPAYIELHLEQLRGAGSIKDADSLKGFWDSQMAVSEKIREKMLADSKAFSDLGVSLLTELSELAEKNADGFAQRTRKATKATQSTKTTQGRKQTAAE